MVAAWKRWLYWLRAGAQCTIYKVLNFRFGILLPKLFDPTVRKNFEITRSIYSSSERSEEFLVTECFCNLFVKVSLSNELEQFKLEKIIRI